MLGPYLIDLGLSLETVGLLSGASSIGLGLAGAILGGALVRVYGIGATMRIALALQALMLVVIALSAAGVAVPRPVVVGAAMLASSAVTAIGFTALYAQFMAWADPAQGGVDLTVFQCLDATIGMALGVLVGLGAEYRGYDTVFGIAAAAALAMALILPTARNRPARPAA